MEKKKKTKKLPSSSISFLCKWNTAKLINLFSSVINDNSVGKLSEVPLKSSGTKSSFSREFFLSTEKAYSSFPCLSNLKLILFAKALQLHGFNLCSSITSKLTAPFSLARLVLDPRAEVIGKTFVGVWAFWIWHHLNKKVPHFQWQQEHLLLRDHSCDFLSKISLIVCVFCLFVCFFPFFWDFSSFFFS